MQKHSVLILGSGGREHALGWKIAQSPMLEKLYFAPGNGGTCNVGENVALNPLDFAAVGQFIKTNLITILLVGPEEPLVKGIVDYFQPLPEFSHLIIVGPDSKGAQLEGSKSWSKAFMQKYHIPTAAYRSFNETCKNEASDFLKTLNPPYVIKASGLAAGKGVIISSDLQEAQSTVIDMLGGSFGEAGKEIVIEEFLDGIEVSVFVLTDGRNYALLPEAKDYKRIGNGNTGPNTGGMGAVSPVAFADSTFMQKVKDRIILPTLAGLMTEGITYKGFIFFGLIKVNNEPYVIEYNARMGDPETEAVMPRLKNDLLELFVAMPEGKLGQIHIEHESKTAVTVVMTSGGYPGKYEKGLEILGLDKQYESIVFHAGTEKKNGMVTTNGGRVLAITSLHETPEKAMAASYQTASSLNFKDNYYRNDIGKDIL